MSTIAHRSMTQRMMGAAKLDISVYEEVEADTTATGQAAGVVAIVALCSAIGGIGGGASGALSGLISSLVGWALWAGITYVIGDKLLGGTATWGELLRTLGFAQSPGVLFLLGGVPLVGGLIRVAVGLWILVTGVIAIRQALDFGTGRAIATALLGVIPYILLAVLFGAG
ncbi:MAG TPA: YIP1 family protein [Longimicrobiales bacterium]